MNRILVTEDSLMQATHIQLLLQAAGFQVDTAANGRLGLARMSEQFYDAVLTDLKMPEMNGLEMVKAIRLKHPHTPVILMTAQGNEEIAVEALHSGASSYFPKAVLEQKVVSTLKHVLDIAKAGRDTRRLKQRVTRSETCYTFENDLSLIPPFVSQIEQDLKDNDLCDETGALQVAMALSEAFENAINHGNLELCSSMREDGDDYHELSKQRREKKPYSDREVQIVVRLSREKAEFEIEDEGLGFDPGTLPDPTNPANLEKASGRGLLLIQSFMDHVSYNDRGNRISMIKHAARVA